MFPSWMEYAKGTCSINPIMHAMHPHHLKLIQTPKVSVINISIPKSYDFISEAQWPKKTPCCNASAAETSTCHPWGNLEPQRTSSILQIHHESMLRVWNFVYSSPTFKHPVSLTVITFTITPMTLCCRLSYKWSLLEKPRLLHCSP